MNRVRAAAETEVRQMAAGPDENLSLKMIGLAAAAVFANDKLVEFFDTSNENANESGNYVVNTGEWDSGAGSDCSEGVSEVEGEEKEDEGRRKSSAGGGEEGVKGVSKEEEESDRRVMIQPDICAISQLLNFDEVRW